MPSRLIVIVSVEALVEGCGRVGVGAADLGRDGASASFGLALGVGQRPAARLRSRRTQAGARRAASRSRFGPCGDRQRWINALPLVLGVHGVEDGLAAVDDEQQPVIGAEAPFVEVVQQPGAHRLVLGGAVHHGQRHLVAVFVDTEGADHGLVTEPEPVDVDDSPAPVVEGPGPELDQPGGGGLDEAARHRRRDVELRRLGDVGADRFEHGGVVAG